jgi:excisionase family DNA binding protein
MSQASTTSKPFAPEPRLWTVRQTAVALGVSTRSVYRLIGQEDLEVRKIGRATRIVVESVERFVKGAGK